MIVIMYTFNKFGLYINVHTEAHLFSVPNDCLWYDKLWGPSQRVVTLLVLEAVLLLLTVDYRYSLTPVINSLFSN